MRSKNRVIIAAAGSGKTTELINQSIMYNDKKILILTYTQDNLTEIKNSMFEVNGSIPPNVKIQTWFSFLLADCVRPYQNFVYGNKRIDSICFVNGISTQYVSQNDIDKYYMKDGHLIYTDKITKFVCLCNQKSKGLVIKRLESLFDYIFIDEAQDLAGFDFDFLKLLLASKINILLVGDSRQSTYSTNNSNKNAKYKKENIFNLFLEWEKKKLCTIEYKTDCYRCNQIICNIADQLYPEMPKTTSRNNKETGHDGLFYIKQQHLDKYISDFNPQILRFDKRTKVPEHHNALNFGQSKGLSFDRVVIFPNGPIKKFLKSGDISHVEGSKSKFYVALTRARHSVTFVTDENISIDQFQKYVP